MYKMSSHKIHMKIFASVLVLLVSQLLHGQGSRVGIFDNSIDIGHPKNAGAARYDEATQDYYLKGSGFNIWFNRDEFRFVYKKISGDFILTANFAFIGEKGNGHRKMGWMIRESLDEAAASY